MPEGDTIFRAARHLRRALVGRPVVELAVRGRPVPAGLLGTPVVAVDARGKNLLIRFRPGWVLYTHMRMTGSWHLYRPGEPWRKNPRAQVARIVTGEVVAVCFSAPVVELLSAARAARHPVLASLGPDLLAPTPNLAAMKDRLRALGPTPLGEALLDQRALAGIGNVYKSELCFLERLDPFGPVAEVADAELEQLLRRAARLMRENLDTFRRTTHRAPGGRHWVYGRGGEPCFACGAPIGMRRQGASGRSTYFCPHCQSPHARQDR